MIPVVLFALIVAGFLLVTDRAKSGTVTSSMLGLLLMLVCTCIFICAASETSLADNGINPVRTFYSVMANQEPKSGTNTNSNPGQDEELEKVSTEVDMNNKNDTAPDWILNPTESTTEFEYVVVSTDPMISPLDVEKDLDRLMEQVVSERIDELIHKGAGEVAGIDAETIRDNWLQDLYREPYDHDLTKMFRGYAQLKLDRDLYVVAKEKWSAHLKKQRLFQIALVAGSVLSVLAIVFSYFRVDNASQGLYTGRLQIFAIFLLLIVIAAAVNFGNQIDWY